jgi:hypothetical protein
MLAGVLLLAAAPLVVGIFPAAAASPWTDADQAALQKASGDFHAVNSILADGSRGTLAGHGDQAFNPVAEKARHSAAKAELEKQQARLTAAQSRPGWVLWTLRVVGVAAAAAGVWGYFRAASNPMQTAPATADKRTAKLPPKLEALKRRLGR